VKYESYNEYTLINSVNPQGKTKYLFNVFRDNKKAEIDESTGVVTYEGKKYKNKEEWEDFIRSTMKDTPKEIKFFGGNINMSTFFIILCSAAAIILIIVVIILLCKNNQFKCFTCLKRQP
jgi:hypothetical protein